MRHLIADPVGTPPEGELGKVSGAHHQAMALVGEPKQIIRAQSGLDVFEGDVVDRLAARKWVLQSPSASVGPQAECRFRHR